MLSASLSSRSLFTYHVYSFLNVLLAFSAKGHRSKLLDGTGELLSSLSRRLELV